MSKMTITIRTAFIGQPAIDVSNRSKRGDIKPKLVLKPNSHRLLYKFPSLPQRDSNFDKEVECPLAIPNGYCQGDNSNFKNLNRILHRGLYLNAQKELRPSFVFQARNLSLSNLHKSFLKRSRNESVWIKDRSDIFKNIQESIDAFSKAIRVQNVNQSTSNKELAIEQPKADRKTVRIAKSRNAKADESYSRNIKILINKHETISPFRRRNLSMINYSTNGDASIGSTLKQERSFLRTRRINEIVKKLMKCNV